MPSHELFLVFALMKVALLKLSVLGITRWGQFGQSFPTESNLPQVDPEIDTSLTKVSYAPWPGSYLTAA